MAHLPEIITQAHNHRVYSRFARAVLAVAVVATGAALSASTDAGDLQLAAQVTDDGSVLSTEEEGRLAVALMQVEAVTRYRMSVTTLPPGESGRIGSFVRCARAPRNDEINILVVPAARKAQIAIGADIAMFIDDGMCAEIARRDLLPNFARGNYAAGFAAAIRALSAALAASRVTSTGG